MNSKPTENCSPDHLSSIQWMISGIGGGSLVYNILGVIVLLGGKGVRVRVVV
jgi:hypothetical protein